MSTIDDEATGRCACAAPDHQPKLIVVTGGPGAGKTAVLETARRSLCAHVIVLPEAAGIVFGGGFPRHRTEAALCASQRAIYHVQHEMESLVLGERRAAIALCDRGTIDSLAYWPGEPDDFWRDVHSDLANELGRYETVIHLRTPSLGEGYDHSNPLRIERVDDALRIDAKIATVWEAHPNRHVVASDVDFVSKARQALELIRSQLPECCRTHQLAP